MEKKKHYIRENWLIFWGIWGEAELTLRIRGAKKNTFRDLRNFLSGIWVDQCIIFRHQGSTAPHCEASYLRYKYMLHFINQERKIQIYVLQTRVLGVSHTAHNLAEGLKNAITFWDLKKTGSTQV